jgi:hypothetical protein
MLKLPFKSVKDHIKTKASRFKKKDIEMLRISFKPALSKDFTTPNAEGNNS